ncbi:hypothetical protein L596_013741 [Steinernema carpocapsae]|uniref:Uncharacterized protein n=1 Tax=Steinernema carpocapsae TaxID=34508 RepID=A0A4U5P136_STECR|nr:hypothetical protein L596_013741 [Steinernema carpocapsae]
MFQVGASESEQQENQGQTRGSDGGCHGSREDHGLFAEHLLNGPAVDYPEGASARNAKAKCILEGSNGLQEHLQDNRSKTSSVSTSSSVSSGSLTSVKSHRVDPVVRGRKPGHSRTAALIAKRVDQARPDAREDDSTSSSSSESSESDSGSGSNGEDQNARS